MNENTLAYTFRNELLFNLPCIRSTALTSKGFFSYLAQKWSLYPFMSVDSIPCV